MEKVSRLLDISYFSDGCIERNRSTGDYIIFHGLVRKVTDLSGALYYLEKNGINPESLVMTKGDTCIGRKQ